MGIHVEAVQRNGDASEVGQRHILDDAYVTEEGIEAGEDVERTEMEVKRTAADRAAKGTVAGVGAETEQIPWSEGDACACLIPGGDSIEMD